MRERGNRIWTLEHESPTSVSHLVTEQTWGRGEQYTITDILLPFLSGGPPLPPPTRFTLLAARERHLSMLDIGEKERNYLFKSYADLE